MDLTHHQQQLTVPENHCPGIKLDSSNSFTVRHLLLLYLKFSYSQIDFLPRSFATICQFNLPPRSPSRTRVTTDNFLVDLFAFRTHEMQFWWTTLLFKTYKARKTLSEVSSDACVIMCGTISNYNFLYHVNSFFRGQDR